MATTPNQLGMSFSPISLEETLQSLPDILAELAQQPGVGVRQLPDVRVRGALPFGFGQGQAGIGSLLELLLRRGGGAGVQRPIQIAGGEPAPVPSLGPEALGVGVPEPATPPPAVEPVPMPSGMTEAAAAGGGGISAPELGLTGLPSGVPAPGESGEASQYQPGVDPTGGYLIAQPREAAGVTAPFLGRELSPALTAPFREEGKSLFETLMALGPDRQKILRDYFLGRIQAGTF